jgi:LysR family transcriptional regulator for bpeEF and oprC
MAVEMIGGPRFDMILRVGPVADSGFVARRLGSTRLMLCASPAYLEAYGRPSHPRDLKHHHAIIPGRLDEAAFTRWTFAKGNAREVVKVPVRVVLREGIGLGVTAVGGIGVVQMYDIAARPFIEDGSLEVVLEDWSPPSRSSR